MTATTEEGNIQKAEDLCQLILVFEAQKKTLAEDKRRVDEALAKAQFDLGKIMLDMNLTTFGTPKVVASMETEDVASMSDWGDLYAHIQATGDFDLLHRRLSSTAVAERWKMGQNVPGVEVGQRTILKVRPKAAT